MALPKTEHPTFDVEIPTLKTKLKFRPSLYKEEKILLMAKETKLPEDMVAAVRTVVNNCAMTPKFNVDTLSMIDLEWVFLRIRANSISNVSKIGFVDKTDQKDYNFEINFDEVKIVYPVPLPESKIESGGLTIMMKYPSCALYEDKTIWAEDGFNDVFKRESIDKIWQKDTVYSVKDISKEEFQEWVDNLPVDVVQKMNEFINKPPTLFYEINYKNSQGEDRSIKLKTLDDFFSLL